MVYSMVGQQQKKGEKRWNVTPQRLRYRYRLLVRGLRLGPTHLTANRKLSPRCVLLSVTCPALSLCWHLSFHQTYVRRYAAQIPSQNSSVNLSGPHVVLSFSLPFFLNLPPHLFISNYASSLRNLSPLHCLPLWELCVCVCGFFCPRLVGEWVFLCFQLHAKRPPGKSICQHARRDLMGTARAWGMNLYSRSMDYLFQASNFLSEALFGCFKNS